MSFWLPTRDKTGRLWYVGIGLPITMIPFLVGIPLCLLLSCVANAPVESMLSFFAVTGFGFFLFVVAKVSVFRQGRLVSFGSAKMSPQMRTAYRTGWVLMLVGTILALFSTGFASRMQSWM